MAVTTTLTTACIWVKVRDCPGLPMQVCARGSVNYKGIFLDDVCYVPGCPVNVASIAQLRSQGFQVHYEDHGACSIEGSDGTVVGQAHCKDTDVIVHHYLPKYGYAQLDFLNTNSGDAWYMSLDAAVHMTGDLSFLMDIATMSPGNPILTRNGVMLPVCGEGPVKNKHFDIPDVSYVPAGPQGQHHLNDPAHPQWLHHRIWLQWLHRHEEQ